MSKIPKMTPEEKALQQANIDRARRLAQERLDEIEKRRGAQPPER
jgi:hypothetical protein